MDKQIDTVYREIWVFLEMVTYRLLSISRESNPGVDNPSIKKLSSDFFKLEYLSKELDLIESVGFKKLLDSMNAYNALDSAEIKFINKDFETFCILLYSKDTDYQYPLDSLIKEQDEEFGDYRLHQAWGGSRWKGRLIKKNSDSGGWDAALFEENGKYGAKVIFKINPTHNKIKKQKGF